MKFSTAELRLVAKRQAHEPTAADAEYSPYELQIAQDERAKILLEQLESENDERTSKAT